MTGPATQESFSDGQHAKSYHTYDYCRLFQRSEYLLQAQPLHIQGNPGD